MSTKQSVELLAVGISLVPPDFTLTIHIGTNGKLTDMVVEQRANSMLRHEGHVVIFVIIILIELGIGKGIS